jgi:hypothetical protein
VVCEKVWGRIVLPWEARNLWNRRKKCLAEKRREEIYWRRKGYSTPGSTQFLIWPILASKMTILGVKTAIF